MRNLFRRGVVVWHDCFRFRSIRSVHIHRKSTLMGKTDYSIDSVVEVERRFPFNAETESRLIAAGAHFLSEKSFKDTYIDSVDYRLTSADHWLRRRDGKWQLKYPSPLQMSKNSAAEYVECEDEDTILEIVSARLGPDHDVMQRNVETPDPGGSSSSLEALTDLAFPIHFCSFETRRKKFCLDGIVIDLDSMDYGFAIGEMEVLVHKTGNEKDDYENHRKALESIDNVASKLGIDLGSNRSDGKVSNFLKRFKKDHYDFLVNGGVIKTI